MKSLGKVLDVLEYVGGRRGTNVTPSEAAAGVKLPLATASRIMLELNARGYLEKVSRKSGYRIGPMLVSSALRDNRYSRMVEAVAPEARRLGKYLAHPVNLKVLHNGEEILLFNYCPTASCRECTEYFKRGRLDINYLQTRLLVAALSAADRKLLFQCHRKLAAPDDGELERIHHRKLLVSKNDSGYSACAGLIETDGYPPAVLASASTIDLTEKKILEHLKRCIAGIEENLRFGICKE